MRNTVLSEHSISLSFLTGKHSPFAHGSSFHKEYRCSVSLPTRGTSDRRERGTGGWDPVTGSQSDLGVSKGFPGDPGLDLCLLLLEETKPKLKGQLLKVLFIF